MIKAKGITQKEFATFMQVHPSTVNEWVKGKKIPRMDKIDRLCLFFLVNRSDLLESHSNRNTTTVQLDEKQLQLVNNFNSLSTDGKNMVLGVLNSLRVTHSATV